MDVTLQQLRMLREVAEQGTIAAAAERLGYTASAVSQQLGGIERATGVAVLERVGRNVRLTDPGRELVRHAQEVLDQMERARVAMERVTNEVRGDIALAVYESVAATLLGPLLTRLGEQYPDLTIRSREQDPEHSLDALAAGDIDMAFAIDYPHAPMDERPGIVTVAVKDDRFWLAVPHDDPMTGAVISLDEVAERPLIASPRNLSCGRGVLVACREAGFEPDIRHELDDYPTALHLVAAGAGIAMIPDLGIRHLPAGVRVLAIEPPVRRTILLAYREVSAGRPAIEAIETTLRAVIADREPPASAAAGL